MLGDVLGSLYTAFFLAVVVGCYGYVAGTVTAPVLVSARARRLFAALPGPNWGWSYVLWIPVPAAVWGFCFGVAVSASRRLGTPPGEPAVYHAGVDGVLVATAVSAVLWPAVLLYGLPAVDVTWTDDGRPGSVALATVGTAWYLLVVAVPAYMLVVLAGFGAVLSGP